MVNSLNLTLSLKNPKLTDLADVCSSEQDTICCIDSACSIHITVQKDLLRDLKLALNVAYLTYQNNSNSHIEGYGILTNGNFFMSNVAYMAALKHNLIYVSQLANANRSDNRSEFTNATIEKFLINKGIEHNLSVPHSPK